jgi:hypothetical protein
MATTDNFDDELMSGPIRLDLGTPDFDRFLVRDPSLIETEYPAAAELLQTDPSLSGIVLPRAGSEVRHHTAAREDAEAILREGLTSPHDLSATTVVHFDNVNPYVEYDLGIIANPYLGEDDETIRLTNLQKLLRTGHRGQPIKVILDLPAPNEADLEEAKRQGIPPSQLHSGRVLGQGQYGGDQYFFKVPTKYIRGYLDMPEGVFVANPLFEERDHTPPPPDPTS